MSSSPKTLYYLNMFPYPSGATMHVGHASNYIPLDVLVRYQRMKGNTVIDPIGRDSFGLPTENFAIKQWRSAHEVTKENIVKFKEQLHKMDMDYDRGREFATSDPEYYKWTQWIFTKLFEKGLVYRKDALVNRCPTDQTVIANDQVVDGKCERCGSEIIQKKHPQWFIKITDYADRLISDLDLVDRPEETKTMQKNWIGKSEGAEIQFNIANVQNIQKDQTKIIQFSWKEYDEKTSSIIWEAIEIHKKYKDTITEKQFRDIFEQKLIKKWHIVEKEKKISIQEEWVYIGSRFIDLVVDWDILIELKKVVLQKDKDKWIRQLRNYLDLEQKGCGLFLNIAANILEIKRLNYFDKQENETHLNNSDLNTSELSETSRIVVFTTRPDTIYGVTAIMLAPELTDYDDLIPADCQEAVLDYRSTTAKKSAVERQQTEKNKTGIFSGFFVTHPLTGEQIPVRFADYVLANYGTGAVMFVPAHDERDWEFSSKNKLPLKQVISSPDHDYSTSAYTWWWTLINSSSFDGTEHTEAKKAITAYLESLWLGTQKTTYRLRDRSVSRQRYRGSPIPIYYDHDGTPHAIPESELPVVLPLDVANYKPAGKSPLEDHPTFKYYEKDGQTYLRECDTLDTFMCSSFYFLRFVDPHNPDQLARRELLDQTMPVDFYIWGKEHTVGHLLYSRFVHKFLYDQGYVWCPEPFQRLIHQGMLLAYDGRKMSKRRGNVITPDEIIDVYGSDTLRMYELFMWPLEAEKRRDENGVKGVHRFLERVRKLSTKVKKTWPKPELTATHVMIKGVSEDIQQLKFNTAISKMMIYINEISDLDVIGLSDFCAFLVVLAPFGTRISQELWAEVWQSGLIKQQSRPDHDPKMIQTQTVNLPVQINGKMRGNLDVAKWLTQNEALNLIKADPKLSKYLDDITIKKVIYVQDKIVNVIVG